MKKGRFLSKEKAAAEMKSSRKRIIRGADVEGIMFCSPQGKLDRENPEGRQEEDSLKALETFWYNKGLKEGKKNGYGEGYSEGEKKGLEEGFQKGLEKGKLEGREEGKEENLHQAKESMEGEFRESLDLLNKASAQMEIEYENFIEKSKAEIKELLIAICRKILQKEIVKEEAILHVIESLLEQAKSIAHGEVVQILLSPEDLDKLEGRLENLDYDKHNITKLHFISDPSISKGSCRIESSLGMINFDIDRELENLKEEIFET